VKVNRLTFLFLSATAASLLLALPAFAQVEPLKDNAFGLKTFTIESEHFRISYTQGLEQVAKDAGAQFEKLYGIFKNTYAVALPKKTEVLVVDGELTNGLAQWNLNFIVIWCHDLDYTLRGSHDWLRGVCTHEFAHIVSLWSSMKLPSWMPMVQVGDFTHPNDPNRVEIMHVVPSTTIPPWFAEGIAQYEDSRYGTDSWDSHRDMIVRTLTLTNSLLSWDHMQVMTGRGDDFEKTYDHGFSLVSFIANRYGYGKVVSLLRESALVYRLGFNGAVKAILGISAKNLYTQWKDSLSVAYRNQVKGLGAQRYGRKINKAGYDNYWPKFSPDGKKIYFLSNGEEDYSFGSKLLYSYSLLDTVKEDAKIRIEKGVHGFYSIHAPSGLIAYTSRKSPKSVVEPKNGGDRAFDAYIDSLPPEKRKFRFFRRKTERQVTEKKRVFAAAFSPAGDRLACAHRVRERFYLAVVDTNGKNFRIVYPDTASSERGIDYIYSLDWSADGRHIAVSYIDGKKRTIGIFDTASREFSMLQDSGRDSRDPRFSASGKALYFSSDRTGIFNIYRHVLGTPTITRLTNVSGGAFTPDASADEKKLAFANFDEKGYGIYLMDTVRAVEEVTADSLWRLRAPRPASPVTTAFSPSRPYSRVPKMFLAVPTVVAEEMVTKSSNVFKGKSTLLAGGIFNFFDPLAMLGMGSEITAYLLVEPSKILNFISLDKRFFNPEVSYDLGVFATTRLRPTTWSLYFLQRGLADENRFFDETYQRDAVLKYGLTLRNVTLMGTRSLSDASNVHVFAGYNWYNVYLQTEDLYGGDFPYSLAQGARAGIMGTMLAQASDSRALVSPRGVYGKVRYAYNHQDLMNDDQSFKIDTGSSLLVENFDGYGFHEASVSLKLGMPSLWKDRHDLYVEFNGATQITDGEIKNWIQGKGLSGGKNMPSYYKAIEWLPGYTYYYSYLAHKTPKDSTYRDTILITGGAVAKVIGSYRFPILPRSMDTHFWFLYFDKLYGAVNFAAGAGWPSISDVRHFNKERWLSSAGLELRLEALSFDIPMAVKLRWDRGLNRPSRVGGDRFTLGIGFSFDNWEYIDEPDYDRVRAPRTLGKR
jgi:hypothetical protein